MHSEWNGHFLNYVTDLIDRILIVAFNTTYPANTPSWQSANFHQ